MFNGLFGFKKQLTFLIKKLERNQDGKSEIAALAILYASGYADGILSRKKYYNSLVMITAYVKEEDNSQLQGIRDVLLNILEDEDG